jgi:uncharacterized protein
MSGNSHARSVAVRLLIAFWIVVIGGVVCGAIVLQTLGPPAPRVAVVPPQEAAPASAFRQIIPATPPLPPVQPQPPAQATAPQQPATQQPGPPQVVAQQATSQPPPPAPVSASVAQPASSPPPSASIANEQAPALPPPSAVVAATPDPAAMAPTPPTTPMPTSPPATVAAAAPMPAVTPPPAPPATPATAAAPATPPTPAPNAMPATAPAPATIPAPTTSPQSTPKPVLAAIRPGSDHPGPIPAPDPALLQRSPEDAVAMLPIISADGRPPMQAYARGYDSSNRRPRVGLVFAGLGTSDGDSYEAIRLLPGGVTLAFSPYSTHPDRLLDLARTSGHELLLSLPLEPQGFPQNDAGDHALLTGESPFANTARLNWALGRLQGYAGTTGALSTLRGERFANDQGQFYSLLRVLAARGLFYVDPRPGAAPLPSVWSRTVDVVVDEPPVRTEIDAKLTLLEQIARDKGSALGLAGAVRPVTVQRVQIWANGLQDRGVALAPASALMLAPAGTVPPGTPTVETTAAPSRGTP